MWDFSGDEALFFLASGAAAVVGAYRWYVALGGGLSPFAWKLGRFVLACLPLVALAPVYIILQTLADPVFVVGHIDYIVLFLAGGLAWIFWGTRAFHLVGLETPGDLLERNNLASLLTLIGATSGVAFTYAGSNVGNGPTIWTTIIPAFVATLTLIILAGLLEFVTETADAITIDRDFATGLRTGALLAANGAILGRAMAGDWTQWGETFSTFAVLAWPAVVMTVAVAIIHRFAQPTPDRPKPDVVFWGLMPAALIVACAVGYLIDLGLPEVVQPNVHP